MINPIIIYRLANWFYRHRIRFIPGSLTRVNYLITGCDLPASVEVGKGVRFQHFGCGCVIHHTSQIGDNVWFNPHVVLGQDISLKYGVLQSFICPVPLIRIGNGVMLGAGAKVIAKDQLSIGDNAKIGANAVVLTSVPQNACIVGVPGRLVNKKERDSVDGRS